MSKSDTKKTGSKKTVETAASKPDIDNDWKKKRRAKMDKHRAEVRAAREKSAK